LPEADPHQGEELVRVTSGSVDGRPLPQGAAAGGGGA